MNIAIIGAGMAGLSCAKALQACGHVVSLFDKGRGPGGRMASRRLSSSAGDISFDMGAQYFTVRDPGFVAQVELWHASGDVAPWPIAGEGAYIGVPTMNAPLKAMARDLDVRWGTRIGSVSRGANMWTLHSETQIGKTFDAVVCAIPAEQAQVLLDAHDQDFAALAQQTPSAPCWTLMVAFDAPLPLPDVVKARGIIDFAARNSGKPGHGGVEAWVVHATAQWSLAHLEDTVQAVESALMQALALEAGQESPSVLAVSAHRWRFARSGKANADKTWAGHLWNPALTLGVCGDWLLGPRIECAWVSGNRLGEAVIDHFSRAA